MRKFVDLHLAPKLKDENEVRQLIVRAIELDYRRIGISAPPGTNKRYIRKLREDADLNVDLVSRVDITCTTPKSLLKALRQVRRRFEVVAVTCLTKSVARQAAKDHRVDLVNFPYTDLKRRFFDKAEAELASGSYCALELDMNPLLTLPANRLVPLLRTLRQEVRIAEKFDVKIVLSSGVNDVSLMRHPYDYVSLARLFDLDKESALDSLSEIPNSIIERNRRKLSPDYVAPGVFVVRRGGDG